MVKYNTPGSCERINRRKLMSALLLLEWKPAKSLRKWELGSFLWLLKISKFRLNHSPTIEHAFISDEINKLAILFDKLKKEFQFLGCFVKRLSCTLTILILLATSLLLMNIAMLLQRFNPKKETEIGSFAWSHFPKLIWQKPMYFNSPFGKLNNHSRFLIDCVAENIHSEAWWFVPILHCRHPFLCNEKISHT